MNKSILFLLVACLAVLTVTSCKKEEPEVDTAPLFPVSQNNKWGYIDATGSVVVEPQFDMAWDFSEGLGRVRPRYGGHGMGYINGKGKIVIKPQLDRAHDFSEGLACVVKEFGGKWGYINRKGKYRIEAFPFSSQ